MHPSTTTRAADGSRIVAVIPARWGSTRFPGKPLVDLDGIPMIVRVAARVRAAARVGRVLVATDDARIAEVTERAGFTAVMTPSSCASGTDRVACALRVAPLPAAPELVLNVQGDEPLIDPADLDALVEAMESTDAELGTLARPLGVAEAFASPQVVKVVVALDGRALYFSRAPIPARAAHAPGGAAPALQHVGVYAYRPAALARLAALPAAPLELTEGLEQLRALEHGLGIHVARCRSSLASVAVDVPADVARVLERLRGVPSGGADAPGRASPPPTNPLPRLG